VTSGVPQGSIVSPLLFLVYVNNLPDAAEHSKVPMFADDSKCYQVIETSHDTQLFQSDLHSLCNWFSSSELKFKKDLERTAIYGRSMSNPQANGMERCSGRKPREGC
jgi:hypothetical protein